jgi:methionyl-tRNA formyltransferase
MRTTLITNGNLLSMIALGDFLLDHRADIGAVFVTTRLPSQKSNVFGLLSMLRHSGWDYTHFKVYLNRLLPMRLKREGLPSSVAELLALAGCSAPVREVANINDRAVIEEVRATRPEILLSFSATQRFSDALIGTPSRCAINAHYALLPGYAGLSPYYWYLHQQEKECGVTLHQIVSKLDAGPIIEQQRFSTDNVRTVAALLLKQMELVSPMLERFYDGTTSERLATPQDLSKRSYFRHPTRQQVAEFRRRGFSFCSEEDTQRLVMAARRLRDRARAAASPQSVTTP